MDGSWDFYFCRVDDAIASIYLNLDLRSSAPLAAKPVMAYVRVYLKDPRPDGLSSDADFEDLVELEDKLVPAVGEQLNAVFVGRNTSGGCRDFYFYAPREDGWSDAVSQAVGETKFEFETGVRPDPGWSIYTGFLFPSERDLQRMQNRRTCDVFESKGDKLDSERQIDHWIYFETQDAQREFLDKAKSIGFAVRGQGGPDEKQSSYWAQVFRVDVLSRDNIDAVCLELFDLAQQLGGDYDGWEAPVHAE